MRHEDIPQVIEVDKLAFPIPWSSRSYLFEINDNDSAHMVVLETEAAPRKTNGLLDVLRRLSGPVPAETIAGYGGFWLIDGEAHISTIAVHPDFRGKWVCEILLAGNVGPSLFLKKANLL